MANKSKTETPAVEEAVFLVGYSDERPESLPRNSIYYEKDTRNRYRYLDGEYHYIDTVG